MKRVLILDGAIFPDIYRPEQHWRALLGDVPCDRVHLPSGGRVPSLGRYTHLIVSGSESSITTQGVPWYEVEVETILRAADAGLAILGSCFGHQMLAFALSGPQYVAASPTPELGWIAVDVLADDILLAGMPRLFHVFAAHFDEVRDPPEPWRVLARSAGCGVQVMRWGERPIWGIQAHPEIDPAEARVLLEGFLRYFPQHEAIVRRALAMEPRDDGWGAQLVRSFLAASV